MVKQFINVRIKFLILQINNQEEELGVAVYKDETLAVNDLDLS
jgi:hypothetical protein